MKIAFSLFITAFVFSLCTAARAQVTGNQIEVRSSTLNNLKQGTMGTYDITTPAMLKLITVSTSVEIPYASLKSYTQHVELARHLGVLPTIAVGLVRRRERKHIFSLSWTDTQQRIQTVVIEVSKTDDEGLFRTLTGSAPDACQSSFGEFSDHCPIRPRTPTPPPMRLSEAPAPSAVR